MYQKHVLFYSMIGVIYANFLNLQSINNEKGTLDLKPDKCSGFYPKNTRFCMMH